MEIVKAGKIGEMCHPNALMTINEYCLQYGDDELKQLVDQFTENELAKIKNDSLKEKVTANIIAIKKGVKDLYV
jgi:2-iminoacetate synthase